MRNSFRTTKSSFYTSSSLQEERENSRSSLQSDEVTLHTRNFQKLKISLPDPRPYPWIGHNTLSEGAGRSAIFLCDFFKKSHKMRFWKNAIQNFEFFKKLEKPIGLRLRPFQNSEVAFCKKRIVVRASHLGLFWGQKRPSRRKGVWPPEGPFLEMAILGRANPDHPKLTPQTPKRRPLTVQPSAPPKTKKTYTIPFPPRQTT